MNESTQVDENDKRQFSWQTTAILFLVLVLVVGLFAHWLSTRQQFRQIEKTLSRKLEEQKINNTQSLALAKQAENRSVESQAKIVLLEQRLAESKSQQEALQTLYDQLARGRENQWFSETEQLLILANQQLQIANNIKPALLALQSAESRLQQSDNPTIVKIRVAIQQDISRIQSLPSLDIAELSLTLDALIKNVDQLNLITEPAKQLAVSEKPHYPIWAKDTWSRFASELWFDIKKMVRIDRIDYAKIPLLSPEQHFFLRENIKLHLLLARIALLQHDDVTFQLELRACQQLIKQYFDNASVYNNHMLTELEMLLAKNVSVAMPDIQATLNLLNQYKLSQDTR